MKIAIVLNTSWNIYNFRMGLIRELMEDGHEVIAIAPKDAYSANLIAAGCKFINLTMDSRGVNPIKDTALTIELYRIYQVEKPDVILHFTIKPNIYGTLAARTLGIPVINNVSGLGTVFLWKTLASRIAIWMYRVAFKSANHVFFQNEDDRELFMSRVKPGKLKAEVLPGSGIDVNHFKPNGYLRNKEFTFVMVARLLVDKGVEEFVEAVSILKKRNLNARFLVFGNIEANHKRAVAIEKVSKWTREGQIEYMGVTDNIREHIGHSDCVVLPSYREGTPRTLLEGASMGKPLIATEVPGCKEVVHEGYNGMLCKVKDAQDLADKMAKMAELSEDERSILGENSRKLILSKFDESIVISKYKKAISSLTDTQAIRIGEKKAESFASRAAAINL